MAAVTHAPMVLEAVERFGRALRERFGSRVRDVILFGSHARGEAHEESDADVMVAVDDLTDDERIGVFDLAVAVDRSLPEWVGLSPLAYSTAQTERMRAGGRRLFRDIEREGIRL